MREEDNEMAQMKPMVKKDMKNKSWWCQEYVGWDQGEIEMIFEMVNKRFLG